MGKQWGFAKRTEYGGRLYHSKREAQYAEMLDSLRTAQKQHDRVANWTAQVGIPLRVEGVTICRYMMDFVVEYADGRTEWHEIKGHETAVYKIKMKLLMALYPNETVKVIR